MFAWRKKALSGAVETISAGEDDDQCAGEVQSGSYWAKAVRMRERECLCLDNKLLQLIYSLAGRAGG